MAKDTKIDGNVMTTKECLKCAFGSLTDKKTILCVRNSKEYIYGKRIVCDEFDKKEK